MIDLVMTCQGEGDKMTDLVMTCQGEGDKMTDLVMTNRITTDLEVMKRLR